MKKLLSLVLCLSLLLGMTACSGSEPTTPTTEPTVPPTTTEPAPDAAELYAQAAEKIRSADAMLINYTLDKTMTIGQDTFLESEKVSLSLATAADGTVAEGIEAQAHQSCKNVGAVLQAAGSDFSKVIKTTCFLADMADFAQFNAVYESYFISKPARSCVAVKTLPKNVLCEIEAIAEK